jgi:hypothetical protein
MNKFKIGIKIIVLLMLVASATMYLVACKDSKAGISFNLTYNTNFTVNKSTPITLPFNLLSPPITTNSEAEFEKNNTNADKVIEVKALSGLLTITAPSGTTFSFVKDAYLYISADGLSENLIAFKENVGDADETITLELPNVDLAPYIKAKSFTLRLKVTTDESVTKDVDINVNVLFRIKANPLK